MRPSPTPSPPCGRSGFSSLESSSPVECPRVFPASEAGPETQSRQGMPPGVYAYRELVEAGGLMSFGPSYPGMRRRAAYFVDKILKGAKHADLPVARPTKFEVVVNLKAATALGLTIPQSLLVRADEIIQ